MLFFFESALKSIYRVAPVRCDTRLSSALQRLKMFFLCGPGPAGIPHEGCFGLICDLISALAILYQIDHAGGRVRQCRIRLTWRPRRRGFIIRRLVKAGIIRRWGTWTRWLEMNVPAGAVDLSMLCSAVATKRRARLLDCGSHLAQLPEARRISEKLSERVRSALQSLTLEACFDAVSAKGTSQGGDRH